mmetsp:Transcript_44794/g.130459  ORF Transcript_44794/g.130459 Transcript_44794/m.130459 type:complete len:202 (+) Transcript_44794:944-1549(+)
MAWYDSTTSFARILAAMSLSDTSPPCSARSQRRSVFIASKRTFTTRSSRPLRRTLATEFRCPMLPTKLFCASTYPGTFCHVLSGYCSSKLVTVRSCSMARTMRRRAFSSISMSSAMYLCSKLAHAKSNATRDVRSSEREGRCVHCGWREAWLQRSNTEPRSHQARWRASARLMASALNSNLSPLTQIVAYCSKPASNTSTR